MKKVTIRLGLILGSLTLVLVILEVGVRFSASDPWRPTGVVAAPGSGKRPDFRDRFDTQRLEKRENTFRILVVGDSFTWGSGVHPEDAYPDRLERRLRDFETDREVEVINWSGRGWNTALEWSSLIGRPGRLDRLEPDLLIVGYCLNDAEPRRTRIDPRTDLQRREPQVGIGLWMYQHSRTFRFIYSRLENTRQRRAFVDYYTGLYDEDAPGRRLQLETFTKWKQEMRRRRIPMVLMIFPIFDSHFDSSYPYRGLHALMTDLGHELEIPVLDLWPVYEGMDVRRLAVEPWANAHPNELAHRLAADALLEWLLEMQLLPVASRPRQ